ncbi:dynein axonemal assembly factor 6 [Prorops nasuta]|uniref:dynein axonemal assembly factor 6 n=1 Tax=Prorops nasuta TaxID=863751 RepID=UPI0034CE664B
MEGSFSINEVKALQNLFAPPKGDSDSDDDLEQGGARKLGPRHIGGQKENKDCLASHLKKIESTEGNIWHPSEVNNAENPDIKDPRKVPEYEMKFKQSVTPEDLYLGVGFKTPGTASCEWLSVSVKLPQEVREKVELSVNSDAIDIRSTRYRLHLPTPHPVEPNASSAKWHNETSTLEINLRLIRELDPLNF